MKEKIISAEIGYEYSPDNKPLKITFKDGKASFVSQDFMHMDIPVNKITFKYRLTTDFYMVSFDDVTISIMNDSRDEFEELLDELKS